MKIIKVYKELRDVVIFVDDDGQTVIRAGYEDEGTDEEQNLIKVKYMGKEVTPKNVETLRLDEETSA